MLMDAALAVPVLPCSAIALRRFRASSRPERVALAVLSVACVITYLVNMEFAIRVLLDAGRVRPASIRFA